MSSLADLPELVGFFSYSRDDDESYRGRLSALREAIQHELSAQLGRSRKNFRLWQDHEAIAPGRLWEAEIKTAVEQAVFFIPIVTPRAVNSQFCRYEFESFLARERALGRSDLVFPILYVPVPALENEALWRDHPILSVIGRRQYVDWQTFRYADAPTPAMREEIARFARKIVEALSQPWLSPQERHRQEEAAAQAQAESDRRGQEAEARQRAEEETRRRNEETEAQRLAEEAAARKRAQAQAREHAAEESSRREADAKRRSEDERALSAAKAVGEAGVDASFATHRKPKPRWQPSRRAMLIGGGALGVGAIGAAAIIASHRAGPDTTPTPTVANTPAAPAAPAIVKPLAGDSVKIGFCNPLTGFLAALGANQLKGCQLALDQLNTKNGILGRKIELVAVDATDPVMASAKAQQLIVNDKVDVLVGNLASAAALAMSQISSQDGILQIVPGARADEITGAPCKWNVFRLGSTTLMQANAICPALFKAYGKTWCFITPDFAFGRTAYQHYDASLKKLGGRIASNNFVPLGTSDFSAELVKARAAKPDVLVLLLTGNDLVNCLKQAREFGIDKQLHIGGGQLDLETIQTMPSEARLGTWVLDWYWRQAAPTPGLDAFVAAVRKATGKVPTAHTWFGYAAVQAYALACEAAKSTDSKAVARSLANMPLPLEIRMQPYSVNFRGGDHQLLSSAFIGELLQSGDGDPENLFRVTGVVAGDGIAPSVAETGCMMRMPA